MEAETILQILPVGEEGTESEHSLTWPAQSSALQQWPLILNNYISKKAHIILSSVCSGKKRVQLTEAVVTLHCTNTLTALTFSY